MKSKHLRFTSPITPEDKVTIMFNWNNVLKFEVGDRVSIGSGVTGEGQLGTVVALDRARIQWHVRLDSGTEYWYNKEELELMPFSPRTAAPPVDTWLNKCSHELKLYTGLTEQFNYCHKCGLKEDEL